MVLPSAVKATYYKIKTNSYGPQDSRFYQHQKQSTKQDRANKTLPEMEILQIIQQSQDAMTIEGGTEPKYNIDALDKCQVYMPKLILKSDMNTKDS